MPSLCHRQPGGRRRRRAECLFWSARPRRLMAMPNSVLPGFASRA